MKKKLRSVNTHIWIDTWFTETLNQNEKLVWLYLLTSPYNNLAGIYEIPISEIAFKTKIDQKIVLNILNNFEISQKIVQINGYIILNNFLEHQNYNTKMLIGAKNIISQLPESVRLAIPSEKHIETYRNISKHSYKYEEEEEVEDILIQSNKNISLSKNEILDSSKIEFEKARKLFPNPHSKRGMDIEFENFQKVCKKDKLNISEIVKLLVPSIEAEIKFRKSQLNKGNFVPEWKIFKTWINQHCWEQEYNNNENPSNSIKLNLINSREYNEKTGQWE